ncbi:hypothetical protein [Cacatuid alphaherpesvirus 2]|uniref:Ig-like domain-containing protein n=1 Tax=Cacatuid alphaherpesvirus 2 TaxID=2604840 RepID=A0A5B9R2K6_9ALPH|nr:hypothetical protein QKT46_gp74 [Cacatuid alphaherpesvirus 2]QEG54053.1 hypothetical protein [Cacatuid alphaherpesvirus 2]
MILLVITLALAGSAAAYDGAEIKKCSLVTAPEGSSIPLEFSLNSGGGGYSLVVFEHEDPIYFYLGTWVRNSRPNTFNGYQITRNTGATPNVMNTVMPVSENINGSVILDTGVNGSSISTAHPFIFVRYISVSNAASGVSETNIQNCPSKWMGVSPSGRQSRSPPSRYLLNREKGAFESQRNSAQCYEINSNAGLLNEFGLDFNPHTDTVITVTRTEKDKSVPTRHLIYNQNYTGDVSVLFPEGMKISIGDGAVAAKPKKIVLYLSPSNDMSGSVIHLYATSSQDVFHAYYMLTVGGSGGTRKSTISCNDRYQDMARGFGSNVDLVYVTFPGFQTTAPTTTEASTSSATPTTTTATTTPTTTLTTRTVPTTSQSTTTTTTAAPTTTTAKTTTMSSTTSTTTVVSTTTATTRPSTTTTAKPATSTDAKVSTVSTTIVSTAPTTTRRESTITTTTLTTTLAPIISESTKATTSVDFQFMEQDATPLYAVQIVNATFSDTGELSATCLAVVKSPYNTEFSWRVNGLPKLGLTDEPSTQDAFNGNIVWKNFLRTTAEAGRNVIDVICAACTTPPARSYCMYDLKDVVRQEKYNLRMYFDLATKSVICAVGEETAPSPRFTWLVNGKPFPSSLTWVSAIEGKSKALTVWKSGIPISRLFVPFGSSDVYECAVYLPNGKMIKARDTWSAIDYAVLQKNSAAGLALSLLSVIVAATFSGV